MQRQVEWDHTPLIGEVHEHEKSPQKHLDMSAVVRTHSALEKNRTKLKERRLGDYGKVHLIEERGQTRERHELWRYKLHHSNKFIQLFCKRSSQQFQMIISFLGVKTTKLAWKTEWSTMHSLRDTQVFRQIAFAGNKLYLVLEESKVPATLFGILFW